MSNNYPIGFFLLLVGGATLPRFFDNVSILASIKVINKDPKKFGALGLTHWLVAIIVNLALISRTLLRNWWTMKAYKKY
jgi:hypothetical protein